MWAMVPNKEDVGPNKFFTNKNIDLKLIWLLNPILKKLVIKSHIKKGFFFFFDKPS